MTDSEKIDKIQRVLNLNEFEINETQEQMRIDFFNRRPEITSKTLDLYMVGANQTKVQSLQDIFKNIKQILGE